MLLGIVGKKGAGKTTIANVLCKHPKVRAKRLEFARPLKFMLASVGVPHENLYGTPEDKERPLVILGGASARHAMQTLGDWGRTIYLDFWVNRWCTMARKALSEGRNVVVDDVRYANEVNAVRDLGGVILGVYRPGLRLDDGHSSENQVLTPDIDVVNDGEIEDLRAWVNAFAAANMKLKELV